MSVAEDPRALPHARLASLDARPPSPDRDAERTVVREQIATVDALEELVPTLAADLVGCSEAAARLRLRGTVAPIMRRLGELVAELEHIARAISPGAP